MSENKISNKQVTRAGEYFVDNWDKSYDTKSDDFNKSIKSVQYWRQVHQEALEPAFTKLETLVYDIDKEVVCAKRLKRLATIIIKLYRFKQKRMTLRNMQDVGGCRAILSSSKKLKQTIRKIQKEPQFKKKGTKDFIRIDNYVKNPKPNGYRGFHIVGLYPDNNNKLRKIEIQLRSEIQHYWATAVEITDLFNKQSLKSNGGDPDWARFFLLCSEIFEIIEDIYNFENIDRQVMSKMIKDKLDSKHKAENILDELKKLFKSLGVLNKLSGYMESIKDTSNKIDLKDNTGGYVLFKINTSNYKISKKYYSEEENELANSEYSIAETFADNETIVSLIFTSNIKDLKNAYPNYYADSTVFLTYLDFITSIK